MKISGKLYLLLAFGLFGLLLNAGITLRQLSTIDHSVSAITQNAIPSMTHLTGMRSQLNDARRGILKHVLAKGSVEKNAQRQAIDHARDTIKAGFERYRKDLASDERDRANIDDAEAAINKLFTIVPNILTLSDQEKIDAARELIAKETTPASQAAAESLNKAIAYNQHLADLATQDVDATLRSSRLMLLTIVIVTAAILAIGGIWLVGQIRRPLEALRHGVIDIAAKLDFTQRIATVGHDEISETVTAVNHLLATLQQALTQIRSVGDHINGSAHNVATASQQMSKATQHVSEATAGMSAAVEQMTVSVTHVADRAEQADGSGRQAGADASDGSTVISRTIAAIRSTSETVTDAAAKIEALQDQTARIDAVVGVIRDIADQTNLLALNAAIEAARAGDTGRGFAVVADEVRKLAERTALSTQEISGMIQAIQAGAAQTVLSMQHVVAQVGTGVSAAEQATTAIERILGSTHAVVDQISQISGAMREQSQASNTIAQQIERVAEMTEQSSASTQATADSAHDLREQASTLHGIIARFHVAA